MFSPATLAALVRMACPIHGWGKGIKFELDHANGKLKFTDEDGNYPFIDLPDVITQTIFSPELLFESGWGWKKETDSEVLYLANKKVIEITSAVIAIYNTNGNKVIHIDRDSGSIYSMGEIKMNGISFPA